MPGVGTAYTSPSFVATSRHSDGEFVQPGQLSSIHSLSG